MISSNNCTEDIISNFFNKNIKKLKLEVTCNETNNSEEDRAQRKLNIDVKIYNTKLLSKEPEQIKITEEKMDLRRKLQITLEEEDLLVNMFEETFKKLIEQNMHEKLSRDISIILSKPIDPKDKIACHYMQEFNIGSIQAFLNLIRANKKRKKK